MTVSLKELKASQGEGTMWCEIDGRIGEEEADSKDTAPNLPSLMAISKLDCGCPK